MRDRVDLDLDQQIGIDQPGYFEHRRGRADIAEYLAVNPADRFPVTDVHDEHAGADDIRQTRAAVPESVLYAPQDKCGLEADITGADDVPIVIDRCRSLNVDRVSQPHSPGIPDRVLPYRPREYVLPRRRGDHA